MVSHFYSPKELNYNFLNNLFHLSQPQKVGQSIPDLIANFRLAHHNYLDLNPADRRKDSQGRRENAVPVRRRGHLGHRQPRRGAGLERHHRSERAGSGRRREAVSIRPQHRRHGSDADVAVQRLHGSEAEAAGVDEGGAGIAAKESGEVITPLAA